MTKEEKEQFSKNLMEKMKSIPQLGILYDTLSRNMPDIMELALKETLDNFYFDKKITKEEYDERNKIQSSNKRDNIDKYTNIDS